MIDSKGDAFVQPWEMISSEDVYDCGIFTLQRVERRSPASGRGGAFFRMTGNDWVNVIAVTADGMMVLVRQFRHGAEEISLEIPGGIIDDGESPAEAAARELLEETGYGSAGLQIIGRVRSNPALFDNWTYTALATDVEYAGRTAMDEHEEIDVELHPIGGIDELLRSGRITHALVLDAFLWYRLREPGNNTGAL